MNTKLHFLGVFLGLTFVLASCKSSTAPQGVSPVLISGGNDLLVTGERAVVLANGSNTLYTIDLSQISATDRSLLILNEGNFGKTNSSLEEDLLHRAGANTDTILEQNILPDSVHDVLGSIPMGLDAPNKMALIAPDTMLVTRRNTTSAALVEINTSRLADSIPLGGVSIAVAVLHNKAYITTGATEYGGPFHVVVFDLASRKIVKTLLLPESPEQAVADSTSGTIIIGTSGDGSTTSGKLYFINATSDAITDSLTPGTPADDPELTTGSKHFLIMGPKIYPISGPIHQLPPPIIDGATAYYKGMYDVASDALYLGNPGDYSNPGELDVYSASTGKLLWSQSAGIIPGHFAFYH